MDSLFKELEELLAGSVIRDNAVRKQYSHDASIYEITPELVIEPQNTTDIKRLIKFVSKYKQSYPSLALTPRGAGTDMSGAAIGHSLLLDMTKHFNTISNVTSKEIHLQPGVFLHDLDPILANKGLFLGSVPASRALNTIGGMVGNNSGGEQSLRYGNTERWVRQLKVVLADGNEYTIKPLSKYELGQKMKQTDFEGRLYTNIYNLIEKNYDLIKNARPKVNKNSMGYNLWSVWDRKTEIFDLTHLITGSQGTLGIITDIWMEPIPSAKHSGLLIAYLTKTADLAKIIPIVSEHNPSTFEGFDDVTFNLGLKHFKNFRKRLGAKEWAKQQMTLVGSAAKFKGHLPNLVLMIEFEADTYSELNDKLIAMQNDVLKANRHIKTEIEGTEEMSRAFWTIRRASLSLLREQIKDKYAAPFIDDLTVQPRYVPEFLPKIRRIIRKYKLPVTISGHFGDGNFHLVPLVDISSQTDRAKLEPILRELIPIVKSYGGTLAGEHNDGMIRGPWLPAVFGDEVYQLFKHTKELFDPLYIFNPHKKTDASLEYSNDHIRSSNSL